MFDIIDEHGFISEAERLRGSYRGRIDDIVKRISLTQLNKSVDISYQFLSKKDLPFDFLCTFPIRTPRAACVPFVGFN